MHGLKQWELANPGGRGTGYQEEQNLDGKGYNFTERPYMMWMCWDLYSLA